MKKIFTLFLKINLILFVFGIMPNQLLASNNSIALVNLSFPNSTIVEEWKTLIETSEISIYYLEITNNSCMSYKLKIVNHTNQKQIVSFAVAAKLADDCKAQYKTFSEFQFRKIEIEPNTTLVGDENTKSLLLPSTTKNIKELIQNLSSQ